MTGLTEFLHMGGYAFYVWTAYGAALAVLALNLAAPIVRRHRLLRGRAAAAPRSSAAPPTPSAPPGPAASPSKPVR